MRLILHLSQPVEILKSTHKENRVQRSKRGKVFTQRHKVKDAESTFPNFRNHPLYKGAKEFQQFIGQEFCFKIADPIEPDNPDKTREFRWKVRPSDYVKLVFHKEDDQTFKADCPDPASRAKMLGAIITGKRYAYKVDGFQKSRVSQISHLKEIFENPHYVLQGVKGSDDEGKIVFIRRVGDANIPTLVEVPIRKSEQNKYVPDGIELEIAPVSMHPRRPSNIEGFITGGRYDQIYPKITERQKQKRHS